MATIPANTYNFKLCFNTDVCPEWTAAAIIDGMLTFGFEGVEFQVGKGHLHGVELDSPPDLLQDVRKQFDEANTAIACLATTFAFSSAQAEERARAVEDLKQCLRVADSLGTPYVRVFGGAFPPGHEAAGVIDYVSEALAEAAEFAETEKLRSMVLLETHGSFSHSKYILEVMHQVYSPKIGILWDPLKTICVLEKVEQTYDWIGNHVRHVHIYNGVYNEGRTKVESCPSGEGLVPMDRVVDLLKAGAFRGYLSFEALQQDPDPDEILPQCAAYLKSVAGVSAS